MDVRQRTEEIERLTLASWATFSDASRGRVRPEEQDPIRPVFQRDRDRIIHCKAFRRLKQKTQVFLSPEGDLYRTRLTHTLEVAQIARTIARALRLNEDLTEAISLAHDLGHTPFGHAGESALDKLCPEGFRHYMQSLRVVDKLEKDGRGLNLTWEVRNGIVTHTKGTWAATPEGRIVRMADQIAFVNHDIEDAVRAGVLDPATLPRDCTAVLGETKSQRITAMINSILRSSEGDVQVGAEENEAFLALKDFMYCTVYVDRSAKKEEQKGEKVLTLSPDFSMYAFYTSITETPCITLPKKPDMTVDVTAVIDTIRREGVRLLIFSNPCNPTSVGLPRDGVRRLLRETDAPVVLDEAYMDFWDQSMLGEVEAYDNLILLRTCSKALGMAALRVGFAVANPTLTGIIRAAKSPYNVNAVSQAMAAVVLENPAYHEIYRELLLASRDMLVTGLKALEADGLLQVYDSCTNFAYLQVPEAKALFAGLADRGIIVRRFGEEHLRITAGTQAENQEVLAVLNFLLRHPDALAEYK